MTPQELRSAAVEKFRIGFPAELPLSAHVSEIEKSWRNNQIIIVSGETGSGKTTQLPKIALKIGCGRSGRIGCTQPRRIAAQAMARRLSAELGCSGREVASAVRFDDRSAPETVLKFMTDGLLLAQLRHDPLLKEYDCLIVDEAHERSLNIDFLLGVLRNILPRRPELKVAVSSATLDTDKFRDFFGNIPVHEIPGRTFPVEDIFLPPFEDEELAPHVARAVEELSGFDRQGDILVFLPGEREIRECAEMLNGRNCANTEVLMLYSRLSAAEQQKVFHPGKLRRIILSTNVAETSLTIPGIKFCIDSGLARISRYNPRRRIQELQIEMISQASARQRRGRCGRTADGICIHLYSEEDLQRADDYTDPEIKRTSLAGVILQMALLNLPDIRNFAFIDPPPGQLIREGLRTLLDIKAVNDAGRITHEGRILARLPLDPHLGKMLLEAQKRKVTAELLVLTAGLSIADIKERPADKPQLADQAHALWKDERSDYFAMLKCWNSLVSAGAFESNGNLRRFCKKFYLNFTRAREWRDLVTDLAENLHEKFDFQEIELNNYQFVHESLLCGIPRNIARFDDENKNYRGTDGKKFVVFPGSSLARLKKMPEWIVCFSLVETSRLFGRNAAVIEPQWVEKCVPHICSRSYDSEHFEKSSGFVRAREKVMLGSLLLFAGRRVDFAPHNPAYAREIFIREGLLAGAVSGISEVDKFNAVRAELLEYELRMRRIGGLYDESAAERFFQKNTPGDVASVRALKEYLQKHPGTWKLDRRELMCEDTEFSPGDYPGEMIFAGKRFKVRYQFEPGEKGDGATLYVPENALNLLPHFILDYPIPGYAADFAEIYLRTLPKDVRRNLGGIAQCAALFAEEFKRDRRMPEIAPAAAMAEFLAAAADVEVSPKLFDQVVLPEYLKLKLGILNESGRLKSVVYELPDNFKYSAKVSASLPGVEHYREKDWQNWQSVIPEKVEVPPGSGKLFYPALSYDPQSGSVSRELFTRQGAARHSHRLAVARLFIRENAQLARMLKRGIKVSNELKLSLLVTVAMAEFEDDLMISALNNAADTDFALVRSASDFEKLAGELQLNWSNTLDRQLEELEKFTAEYTVINQLSRRAGEAGEEIRTHLHLLFAPGFLRRRNVFDDYRRYLRALKLRAQRAADAPGKDLLKGEVLIPWIEKFEAALQTQKFLADSEGLTAFWELLEEARIAVYAPEVKTSIKSPLAKLPAAWDDLQI